MPSSNEFKRYGLVEDLDTGEFSIDESTGGCCYLSNDVDAEIERLEADVVELNECWNGVGRQRDNLQRKVYALEAQLAESRKVNILAGTLLNEVTSCNWCPECTDGTGARYDNWNCVVQCRWCDEAKRIIEQSMDNPVAMLREKTGDMVRLPNEIEEMINENLYDLIDNNEEKNDES